jgi:hypothetical protein
VISLKTQEKSLTVILVVWASAGIVGKRSKGGFEIASQLMQRALVRLPLSNGDVFDLSSSFLIE